MPIQIIILRLRAWQWTSGTTILEQLKNFSLCWWYLNQPLVQIQIVMTYHKKCLLLSMYSMTQIKLVLLYRQRTVVLVKNASKLFDLLYSKTYIFLSLPPWKLVPTLRRHKILLKVKLDIHWPSLHWSTFFCITYLLEKHLFYACKKADSYPCVAWPVSAYWCQVICCTVSPAH